MFKHGRKHFQQRQCYSSYIIANAKPSFEAEVVRNFRPLIRGDLTVAFLFEASSILTIDVAIHFDTLSHIAKFDKDSR